MGDGLMEGGEYRQNGSDLGLPHRHRRRSWPEDSTVGALDGRVRTTVEVSLGEALG